MMIAVYIQENADTFLAREVIYSGPPIPWSSDEWFLLLNQDVFNAQGYYLLHERRKPRACKGELRGFANLNVVLRCLRQWAAYLCGFCVPVVPDDR